MKLQLFSFCLYRFYNEFKVGKCETLEKFFREYKPPLTQNANTCVGLGLLLIGKLALLEGSFPGIKDSLYLVSCEESIEVNLFILRYEFINRF